ncbi:MAG: relaxase/mobilization nuclease domain-containing protein, partial [Ruminococcus sp.]|nr:relaxase/mobilization nuclease domain-containing protein [Ruminococcus sp.]
MPIIHFANSKAQNTSGFKKLLAYVSREKKTKLEDRRLVSGVNCSPQTAYQEMKNTKQLHGKTGGRLYYHLVQSFPKGYEISPELAHKIALEFTERAFKDYECVVATHIDREHIHSHIVFNSVSFQTGNKFHSNKDSVLKLMQLSDEICSQYGVGTLDDP